MEEENLHLTLKFLGEVKEERIKEISKILRELSRRFKKFEFSLKNIGAFPDKHSPRVIWVGAEEGREEMIELQKEIEEELVSLGFKKEARGFHPHLTIARVKRKADFKELFRVAYKSRVFLIEGLVLFKSTLTPKGPIYEKVEKFPLPQIPLTK